MHRSFRILSLAVAYFALISFAPSNNAVTDQIVGTYNGGTSVELTLNKDFTYSYFDKSNTDKSIEIDGKWSNEKGKIILHHESLLKFHDSWKMDSEYPCLKSKSGLTFYRLCKD